MRSSKIAVALVTGAVLSLAGAANAGVGSTAPGTAAEGLALTNQVDFLFGGRKHCWYAEGWNGAGWYWCGYATRKGKGWGGGEGFRGWKH
jgi:hypothetical protein